MKPGAAIFALCLLATGIDVPAQDITDPVGVEQSHGEACLALGVFSMARDASWFEQALVVQSIINSAAVAGDVCSLVESMRSVAGWSFPRDPDRVNASAWMQAKSVVRAVVTGDYYIPPPCNLVTGAVGQGGVIPAGTAPVCVVGDLVFVAPVALLPTAFARVADVVVP